MERGHRRDRLAYRQRKVHVVEVKMEEIKGMGLAKHLFEQHQVRRERIHACLVQAQRARTGRYQPRLGDGIATSKQGDLMPLAHEFFREIRDHTFGATIPVRGHAFKQGRDLRDLHRPDLLSEGES
jgi:hypothetical protein